MLCLATCKECAPGIKLGACRRSPIEYFFYCLRKLDALELVCGVHRNELSSNSVAVLAGMECRHVDCKALMSAQEKKQPRSPTSLLFILGCHSPFISTVLMRMLLATKRQRIGECVEIWMIRLLHYTHRAYMKGASSAGRPSCILEVTLAREVTCASSTNAGRGFPLHHIHHCQASLDHILWPSVCAGTSAYFQGRDSLSPKVKYFLSGCCPLIDQQEGSIAVRGGCCVTFSLGQWRVALA